MFIQWCKTDVVSICTSDCDCTFELVMCEKFGICRHFSMLCDILYGRIWVLFFSHGRLPSFLSLTLHHSGREDHGSMRGRLEGTARKAPINLWSCIGSQGGNVQTKVGSFKSADSFAHFLSSSSFSRYFFLSHRRTPMCTPFVSECPC